MSQKTTIVIPVHNEEENISVLLELLLKAAPECDILVVNDNSSDDSGELAEKIAGEHSRVSVVHRKKQEGLHAAIITGLKHAVLDGAEVVITMDGDLSHSPFDVPRLIEASNGNDIVVGSRFISGGTTKDWPAHRKIMSFLARKTNKLLIGVKTEDSSSGFKLYSKEALCTINIDRFVTTGYAFQIETIARAEKERVPIKEVPIIFKEREKGKSKVTPRELVRYFKSSLDLRKTLKKEYDKKES